MSSTIARRAEASGPRVNRPNYHDHRVIAVQIRSNFSPRDGSISCVDKEVSPVVFKRICNRRNRSRSRHRKPFRPKFAGGGVNIDIELALRLGGDAHGVRCRNPLMADGHGIEREMKGDLQIFEFISQIDNHGGGSLLVFAKSEVDAVFTAP
ncbi:MAG: hypothetical protein JWP89_2189 [Schlesneria sp.]|nr:hypothetical protein [Schlesneria sp.]